MNKPLYLLLALLLNSCSGFKSTESEIKKSDPIPVNSTVQPDNLVPPVEVPLRPKEIQNFDNEFQATFKKIWSSYFKENYNESRSLDIYVVTNRNRKAEKFGCDSSSFGNAISVKNELTFGICRINVPKNHSTGEIEFSDSKNASSNYFYKIVNSKEIQLDQILDFSKRSKRTPLIFVHGFNVPFFEAVLRASQLTYDLKYQGPVILFSWPSGPGDGFLDTKNLSKTYEQNKISSQESINHLKNLISDFYEKDINVNIIVHSMGHQILLPILNELGKNLINVPELLEKKIVNELILTAPDYDLIRFKNEINMIRPTAKRITLYCSTNDKALSASSSVNNSARLGACFKTPGVDTINVSLIDETTIGHSYYASRDVISDIFQVLLGLEAERRLFIKKSNREENEDYFLRK